MLVLNQHHWLKGQAFPILYLYEALDHSLLRRRVVGDGLADYRLVRPLTLVSKDGRAGL